MGNGEPRLAGAVGLAATPLTDLHTFAPFLRPFNPLFGVLQHLAAAGADSVLFAVVSIWLTGAVGPIQRAAEAPAQPQGCLK